MARAGDHPRERAQPGDVASATAAAGPRVVRHLRSGLTIRTVEDGERIRVRVEGEVDLDCADTLHQVLADCLQAGPRGVDLDLTGAEFFDCAGLNALLRARSGARAAGAELTVTAVSPAVARVLDLTHCDEAFPHSVPPPPPAPVPAQPSAPPVPWGTPRRTARPA
ncbi:STAS domain-containing protein [Actinacidiphila epipremni]|uniref:Anti-sigma factor antagonist n=1 Tax=Actinacidiphila epipremni TaxID=2053013 RepID=A0ABX0ZR91_9ACTN|nr:STAS domain-containing protein [Actinacidiphila epipremni]NJP45771.1 STAS domain-containing protein [Actinacidiphila epipremni]